LIVPFFTSCNNVLSIECEPVNAQSKPVFDAFSKLGGAYQDFIDFYTNFTVEQSAEYLGRAIEWGQSKKISADKFLKE